METNEMMDIGHDVAMTGDRSMSFNRENVMAVQDLLSSMPQVELPVQHHFSKIECKDADKIYLRSLFHPAGVAVVGFEHLDEHLFILAAGHLTITTDDGDKDLYGPVVMNTKPGMKRVAYAHTDCVVMSIHATNLSDPDEIMDSILKPEPYSAYREAFGGGVK